jgi:protein-S-isoprenylcysteine O-methyltransferase Ste14
MAQDAALVVSSGMFVYIHVRLLFMGQLTSISFAAEQTILVGLFLTRRISTTTSTRFVDWFAAAIGAWLPLAFQPQGPDAGTQAWLGIGLQLTGLSLSVLCLLSLGRSFGVVAANRGLKSRGMYRCLRHPIYACQFVTVSGFLVANWWWLNGLLAALWVAGQVGRMLAEERVLRETSDYASYAETVRWRVLPGVF